MKYFLIFSASMTLLTGCATATYEKTAPCQTAYAGSQNNPCDPLPVNIARAHHAQERSA